MVPLTQLPFAFQCGMSGTALQSASQIHTGMVDAYPSTVLDPSVMLPAEKQFLLFVITSSVS